MSDLFNTQAQATQAAAPVPKAKAAAKGEYTAADIEVLEGLEPVRRRPGMYVGGTDARAYHHLFAEILDNSVDEAIGGHAKRIYVELEPTGFLSVRDDGRGIPVDPHPRFPDKSALEVILTTLHAGGKFGGEAYETSGGLHGVGASVVNALSERLDVEVIRNNIKYRQSFERGLAIGAIETDEGRAVGRGTLIRFKPDVQIFGEDLKFDAARLYRMAEAKAYLCPGVEIRWKAPQSAVEGKDVPAEATLKFVKGLEDKLALILQGKDCVVENIFSGQQGEIGKHGAVQWALAWTLDQGGDIYSFCNTIPTSEGGTHEQGMRVALLRAFRAHAERINHRRFAQVTTEDIMKTCFACLSMYMREPEFVGQTKEKLSSVEATKLVEPVLKDAFEHWLGASPQNALKLMDYLSDIADDRVRARAEKDFQRKTLTRKTRLPGKLADATLNGPKGLELFIVEGDSAGGSAKQARDRKTQAVLPLRGKILNVASATDGKLRDNQQLQDLIVAIGTGCGKNFKLDDLRYEKIIIMTDADVDGAHIACLLITFFWQEMPELIRKGHVYLGLPPLFRLSHGGKTIFAKDEQHKTQLLETVFKGKNNVEIGRFKGLGEMMPAQLRETTMAPEKRAMLRVDVSALEELDIAAVVQRLMGNKAEGRFSFIQERAAFVSEIDL